MKKDLNNIINIKHLIYLLGLGMLCFFCNTIQAQDICEEAGHVLSFTYTSPACPEDSTGSATVASTGCDCMFSGCSYQWSDGQTFHTAFNLPAGTYTVLVTHPDSCVMEVEVVVEDPPFDIEEVEISSILCKGASNGSIKIVPANPVNNPLNYQWSNGATTANVENLGVGTYSVNISDFAGCSITQTYTIEEPTEELNLSWETEAACTGTENGLIQIEPIGGVAPYYCKWNDGIFEMDNMEINTTPGIHQVTVRDANNCEVTLEIEVEEIMIAPPSVTAGFFSICQGDFTNLSAFTGEGNYTYVWSPIESVSSPYSNATLVSPEETTTYTVEITNEIGCKSSTSLTIFVGECETEEVATDIEEIKETTFQAYPNPTAGLLYLSLGNHPKGTIRLYNIQGRLLQEVEALSKNVLDVNDCQSGVYFLEYTNETERVIQKILKNK